MAGANDEKEPEWKRYAASEEQWLADVEESNRILDAVFSRPKSPRPKLPAGGRPDRPGSKRVRSRQVNVKLTPADHRALERAAKRYGVAPATLAQLLVNRGLEAVTDEDSAEEGLGRS